MNKNIKVNLYSFSDGAWILGKFNRKMLEELKKMGIDAAITDKYDPSADINHYPLYTFINHPNFDHRHDTFMITHVDCYSKVELLKTRLKSYGMGICMSKDTMEKLICYGVPRQKLCYINPAHDHVMKPKKYVVGLTYRTHSDYRRRDQLLVDIVKNIDNNFFKFVIMGDGWNDIVEEMRKFGAEVEYYNEFDYDLYTKIVPEFDFYLYYGMDEGNMGWLDALAAGAETIVTPQGYHLDAEGGITYPCNVLGEYIQAFKEIADRKKKRIASVEDWTWEAYTKKHVEIWNYLLQNDSLENIFANRGLYSDGIFSALPMEIDNESLLANDLENRHYVNAIRGIIKMRNNRNDESTGK